MKNTFLRIACIGLVLLIMLAAFAGCKNATIIFMEDDKQLLSEYMNEQRQMNAELYDEDFESNQQYADTEDDPDAMPPKPTPEELAQYYDDFNIRYRIIDIAGEKIVWPSNKLTVSQDAFHGVKEIISSIAKRNVTLFSASSCI